jgi:hypothetical protein
MKQAKEEYISLKEAAEMTGYSSDYIGQLIRAGKLPGKQVFTNVSWVTTRDAVLAYSQKDKRSAESPSFRENLTERMVSPEFLTRLYTILGSVVVFVFLVFVIFFAYIFSVSVDHRINSQYLEQIEYAR